MGLFKFLAPHLKKDLDQKKIWLLSTKNYTLDPNFYFGLNSSLFIYSFFAYIFKFSLQ